jgi:hypothetical protein
LSRVILQEGSNFSNNTKSAVQKTCMPKKINTSTEERVIKVTNLKTDKVEKMRSVTICKLKDKTLNNVRSQNSTHNTDSKEHHDVLIFTWRITLKPTFNSLPSC